MRIRICGAMFAVILLTYASGYAEEQKEGVPKAQAPEKKLSWTDNVQINGDLRYRHETIMQEDEPERNRQRIRARAGAQAKVNDDINLFFRLATGSSADPTSTNQTLTDGFSRKYIWLDLAYFEWRPEPVKGLNLYGGKMKNPFFTPCTTDLIWDNDLTPEGLAVRYSRSFGLMEPSLCAGGFWIAEREKDPDSWLPAAQATLNLKLPNNMSLRVGLGYFDYQNAKGYRTFFDSTKSFGNTIDAGGNYANDFDELETCMEFCFKAGKMPVSIFAEYVENLDAKRNDGGYLTGFAVGNVKEPGDWALRFNYRRLEKDAVIGVFTHSSTWGGGTDGKGAKICFDFMVAKSTTLTATGYFTKKNLDNEQDYKRFQFDIVFKF